jgi:hypothetical protein
MFNENKGRFQRDSIKALKAYETDATCQRVDPAKKRMLKEKFEIAESYLARFIGNILKHFSDERKVQGVRRLKLPRGSTSFRCLLNLVAFSRFPAWFAL